MKLHTHITYFNVGYNFYNDRRYGNYNIFLAFMYRIMEINTINLWRINGEKF